MSIKTFFGSAKQKMLIGDIAEEIKAGFACGKFELENGDIPHLRPMNIDNDCRLTWDGTKYISLNFYEDKRNYSLKKGDLLFNNTNSTELVGKSCYIDQDYECGFSNHMTRIRVKDSLVDSYFLSLLFFGMWKNRIFEVYCHKWVNQSGINTEILASIPISIPPLDEQERIVGLFQSLERAILQAEGQEKNLKSLQKALSNGLVSIPPFFGDLLSKTSEVSETSEVWRTKISEVCECIEEHDRTPLENGLSRFVGLENIEPENFALQGFGNIEDGTTFTKRFAKGDVLFGKRRAYLKKVAVADYDGICSSDILVFRAIQGKILPDLLPYYVSSDAFINHAVSTSAGSLSPRTKWRDLAGFQLSLPDVKTQEKMVDVFNQLSQSLQLLGKQKETLKKLKQKLLNEILG